MAKLMENTFRAANIALASSSRARALGLTGRGHRRRRDQALRLHGPLPSAGVGGHCIPVDPYYLLEPLRADGVPRRSSPPRWSRSPSARAGSSSAPWRRSPAWRNRASSSSASPTSRASATCASRPPWRSSATSTWPACTSTTTTRSPRVRVGGHPPWSVPPSARQLDVAILTLVHPGPAVSWLERLPHHHRRHLPQPPSARVARSCFDDLQPLPHEDAEAPGFAAPTRARQWPAAPPPTTHARTPAGNGRRPPPPVRERRVGPPNHSRAPGRLRPVDLRRAGAVRRRGRSRDRRARFHCRGRPAPPFRRDRGPRPLPADPLRPVLDPLLRLFAGTYLCVIVAASSSTRRRSSQMLSIDPFFAAYGLVVSGYIVTRFVICSFYRPRADAGLEPRSRSSCRPSTRRTRSRSSLRVAARGRLPGRQARDRRRQRRLDRRHAARDASGRRDAEAACG